MRGREMEFSPVLYSDKHMYGREILVQYMNERGEEDCASPLIGYELSFCFIFFQAQS